MIIYIVRMYDLSHSYKNYVFFFLVWQQYVSIEIHQIHPVLLEDLTLE